MSGHGGAVGMTPWHMWGGSVQLSVTGVALVSSTTGDFKQAADVKYRRPELWRFLLVATIVDVRTPSPVAFQVNYQFAFGLGRSNVKIPTSPIAVGGRPFATLEFPPGGAVGQQLWTTQIQAPEIAVGGFKPVIELLPAQDIQVAVQLTTEGSINAGNVLTVEASAYLAPNVHVRPEWWERHFPGGEANL